MAYAHRTYKRTVRCSYCRQEGHNKSACLTYDARMEDMREKYGNDYWIVAQYDEKKAKRKASGKSRKCSYCSEGGHNRGTCTILADHMQQTKEANIAYRSMVFQRMVQHGLFAGALITNGNLSGGPNAEDKFLAPWVIIEVCWGSINLWETEFRYYSDLIRERAPLKASPLANAFRSYAFPIGFPYDYLMNYNKLDKAQFQRYSAPDTWHGQFKNSYFPTVISKVDTQKPPTGWLLCEDEGFEKTLKEFYKKRKATSVAYVGRTLEALTS